MVLEYLEEKLGRVMFERVKQINNSKLHAFLSEVISLCDPSSVFVSTGSLEDYEYIRRRALESGEELPAMIPGHTVHFDSPLDQARARGDTFILMDEKLPFINTKPRRDGLEEVIGLLRGAMKDREMLVGFYSLGPKKSPFQVLAVQITDSYYVLHSENILYRNAYDEFVRLGEGADFLKFIHSQGVLDERGGSKNVDKRRIYIDPASETVYSVNTQYGGNSIGLKKLSLRLTMIRALREGWLAEHMFVIGVYGRNGPLYFAGAYPSASGKTSTSMIGRLIGDDIAFIRAFDGEARVVNPEIGIFGIIDGVNAKDDPLIWEVLNKPGEVIFSNVLLGKNGEVFWNGSGKDLPARGKNYLGEWWPGKKDEKGSVVPTSHPNARFTVPLFSFPNLDPRYDDPEGVAVSAIIYGVRDSANVVPLVEAFDWLHGVVTIGASMETERTTAVLGKPGELEFNPFANLDFMSINLGVYVRNHIEFGRRLRNPPKIYGVNYFLSENGKYLTDKEDKKVWLKWMACRVEEEVEAVTTPIGYLPLYSDLKKLFMDVLSKEYDVEAYKKQFTIKLDKYDEKARRILRIYSEIPETPAEVFTTLEEQLSRLRRYMQEYGPHLNPLVLQ
ncbi:MAG: phosphoenolpyruvate carboxykinase (GTP) [Candidatus Freyarchaeota archaeon]|nr:phosphoenolpyruvate carboxykinase (GTP) [Candidatus Jordarchaeia archaeon]